jgi:hypothetical protein
MGVSFDCSIARRYLAQQMVAEIFRNLGFGKRDVLQRVIVVPAKY